MSENTAMTLLGMIVGFLAFALWGAITGDMVRVATNLGLAACVVLGGLVWSRRRSKK